MVELPDIFCTNQDLGYQALLCNKNVHSVYMRFTIKIHVFQYFLHQMYLIPFNIYNFMIHRSNIVSKLLQGPHVFFSTSLFRLLLAHAIHCIYTRQ